MKTGCSVYRFIHSLKSMLGKTRYSEAQKASVYSSKAQGKASEMNIKHGYKHCIIT